MGARGGRRRASPLRHLRPAALYRLPFPKTKLEAPVPDGIARGQVVLDGALVDVVGWRATVGHNWGREHAERWVWLHAAGFEDEPDAWLELALARVRIGGALSPWIANGAVFVGGQRLPPRRPRPRPGRARGRRRPAASRRSSRASASRSASPSTPTSTRPPASATPASAPTRSRGEREVLHAGLAGVRLGIRRPGRPSAELATAPRRRLRARQPRVHRRRPPQPYPDP